MRTSKTFNKMRAFADTHINPLPKVFQDLKLSCDKKISRTFINQRPLFYYHFYYLPEIVLSMTCVPRGKDFSCLIEHLHVDPCLEDSSFRLDKYLELKDKKSWDALYDLKSKSFYEGFPLFFNTVVKAISQYKELRDILTGALPWQNPILNARPKVNLLQFRAFLNKKLIPGPDVFKKIGLVYLKTESKITKSKVTDFKEHEWYYYHQHPQSKIILKTYYTPETGFFRAYIQESEDKFINLNNYLKFKKGVYPGWFYNAKDKQDPYKIFDSFMKVVTNAILNEGLADIIQGKKWVHIPDSITHMHLYK